MQLQQARLEAQAGAAEARTPKVYLAIVASKIHFIHDADEQPFLEYEPPSFLHHSPTSSHSIKSLILYLPIFSLLFYAQYSPF